MRRSTAPRCATISQSVRRLAPALARARRRSRPTHTVTGSSRRRVRSPMPMHSASRDSTKRCHCAQAGVAQPIVLLEGACSAPSSSRSPRERRCEIVVHSLEQIDMLEARRRRHRFTVWLKLDTGMNRLGSCAGRFRGGTSTRVPGLRQRGDGSRHDASGRSRGARWTGDASAAGAFSGG